MKKGLKCMQWKRGMEAYSSSESVHSIEFVRGYHGISKCRLDSSQM